MQILRS
ncbi:hypothetical protein MTR67_043106 [Solanum verrucosum]|nr:hypothetical protein MTR67_043106 [Solanum verrucosum]